MARTSTTTDPSDSAELCAALAGVTHWRPAPEGQLAHELTGATSVELVKRGNNRAIYRVDLPAGSLYVKHHRSTGWRDFFRQLFRGSTSRREFDKATELRDRQVPTIQPVACGETRQHGFIREHVLVSAAISDATTLADELTALRQQGRGVRRPCLVALATSLAGLCAAAHRAGVYHNDLHAGNILVRRSAQGELELFIVDVPSVRLSGPLGWRRSRQSLAMLLAAMHLYAPRLAVRRFWETYVKARPELPRNDLDSQADRIIVQAQRAAHRVLSSRDDRCWGGNREYSRLCTALGRAYATADLAPATVERLLADPQELLRRNRDQPLKLAHGSVVVRGELPTAQGFLPVAVKRIRPRAGLKWALALCGRNVAARSWRLAHALRIRGITAARPLALVIPRRSWRCESYLLTEWIAGSQNLHLWGWELVGRAPEVRSRLAGRCAAQLGALVGRLHAWRFSHRDLKGCNLIVTEQGADVECHLIDLDGVRQFRRLPIERRAADIARLAASAALHSWLPRSARARFLAAYRRQQPGTLDWRALKWALERAEQFELSRSRAGESDLDSAAGVLTP